MKSRICLAGATGKVGKALSRAIANSQDMELVGAVSRSSEGKNLGAILNDPAIDIIISGSVHQALQSTTDILIDYTKADIVKENVLAAISRGVHVVIGSSGLTDEDFAIIDENARKHRVGVIAAGNFAITAALLQHFATIAARHVPQWEIVEYGSAKKIDAPNGTSRELANRLSQVGAPVIGHPIAETSGKIESRGATVNNTQIHSVRLPGYVSSLEIIFALNGERLSLRHDSVDAAAPYIGGTLLAARKVRTMIGVTRGLDKVLGLDANSPD